VNADSEDDAPVLRHARVALDHRILHLDRAANRVNDAAELDDAPIARALHDPAVMNGDGWVDQIAAQRAKSRQDAILVRTREPAVANNIGSQDCGEFPGFDHSASPSEVRLAQGPAGPSMNVRSMCAPREGGAFQWVQAPPRQPLQPEATGSASSRARRLHALRDLVLPACSGTTENGDVVEIGHAQSFAWAQKTFQIFPSNREIASVPNDPHKGNRARGEIK
jgi:hypothetical protein